MLRESRARIGGVVYPGIYDYRANKGRLSWQVQVDSPDQPLVKVRRFPDGSEFFGIREESLVPRSTTYNLLTTVAYNLVKDLGNKEPFTAIDIGTGSGVTAYYLAKALENNSEARVCATDISPQALETAFMNFQHNKLSINPTFRKSNLLQGIKEDYGKVNFIFSNPPFAKSGKFLQNGFDPAIAYDGGVDGLDYYREIIHQAKDVLTPDGTILFQITPVHIDNIRKNYTLDSLITFAKDELNDKSIGLSAITEGPLKDRIVGVLISTQHIVQKYANLGTI